MTKIRKTIQRETDTLIRGFPIAVEIDGRGITIWRKGARELKHTISYAALFESLDRERRPNGKRSL